MSRTVSIITAVHPPHARFLDETHRSVDRQELPTGWRWEWLITADGDRESFPPDTLPADARVHITHAQAGGPAVARNLALAHATGALVKVLDADDQLAPGALQRDIDILANSADLGWTTASVLDLNLDGSTSGWFHADPPGGRLTSHDVLHYFRENNYRLPIHPASMCIRRDLAVALGGWMALPGGEDTGLLIAAAAVSDGHFHSTPGLIYRKHPGQLTASPNWSNTPEWTTRMRLIDARAQALSASQWRTTASRA